MKIEIIKFNQLESTNTYAREHANELADGALVVCAEQTGGRGRHGRVWVSPAGKSVYATLLMRCLYEPFHAGCIVGLATLRTVREFAPEADWFLKWPNDVYCHDRKVAGLLCESCSGAEGISAVAAGVGLNVNLTKSELEQIDNPATSLAIEAGVKSLDVDAAVAVLAKNMEAMYGLYLDCPDVVLSLWQLENRLIGETITILTADGTKHTGLFKGVALDGELIMVFADGREEHFNCGDVTLDKRKIDWEAVAGRHKSLAKKS